MMPRGGGGGGGGGGSSDVNDSLDRLFPDAVPATSAERDQRWKSVV